VETLAALIARDGKLTPQEAAGWTLRLAQRVQEQHQQGLVHGNVSAYTLLVGGRSPYGKGILVDSPRQAEATFYSPERASSGQLSQADDTWALAVLLFYGLTAQYPFQVNSAIDIARAVALGTPKLVRHGVNDPILQGIFDRALARDPGKRLSTVAELVQSIQQWIKEPAVTHIEPLEDDDEDAPTMMMQSVSIGSPQQQPPPQAPLPAPRPAAGLPAPPVPPVGLPPVPPPPLAPPGPDVAAVNPRQAPTMMAVRPPEEAAPASPFSKGTLTALWVAWAVVTFGGAAVEYVILSR
jgi:serine/threonine-protein kinase